MKKETASEAFDREKAEEIGRLHQIDRQIEAALKTARDCFTSREVSLAITNLEQAQMWAAKKFKVLS